jgi:acyl-CoA thioester hydrolase
VYAWSVPVWQADVDAFGELRTSSLLRLLQETATRASTEAGFDPAYYERAQRSWLVRRSTLVIEAPARYGDQLEARTWIADFRRVRSQREYEVWAGERPIACAHTDWVYVDNVQGQPRRVPPEMEAMFLPEGAAPLARAPFPDATPPSGAIRTSRRVEAHELDALAHVNNANYVHYVEQGMLDACAGFGWPVGEMLAAGGRLRRVEHDLEYLSAARYGDTLEAVVWPIGVDDGGVTLATWIVRDGDARPLLRARSRYAWVTADDGAAVGELPVRLREAFARALA